MDWLLYPAEWAKTALEQAGMGPMALPLAFLLGLASAVASTCCTLPVFGAIVGYAGMQETNDQAFQSAWRFFLHARLDHCSAHFRERRRADRTGRPKRPWRILEGFRRSCRHHRRPRCPESPSFQDPRDKEQGSRNPKTRISGSSSSRTHHRRRGKRMLSGLQSRDLHHPGCRCIAGIYALDVRHPECLRRRLQPASGRTHVGCNSRQISYRI